MSFEIRLASLVAVQVSSETFVDLATNVREILTFLSSPAILRLQELRTAAADAKEARRKAERGYDGCLAEREANEVALSALFEYYEKEVAPLLHVNEVGGVCLPHSLPNFMEERELVDEVCEDLIHEWEALDEEEKRELPLMPAWHQEGRSEAWARHEARAGRKYRISGLIRAGEREARELIRIGEEAIQVASLESPMGCYHWDIRWRAGDDGNSSICPWG